MSDEPDAVRAREGEAIGFHEGDVRITRDTLELGERTILLSDVVSAEETTLPRTPSQIIAAIFGCLILFAAVPSAMMCPLALVGIPIAARVLSWAIRDQDTSFALRVDARGRAPLVVRYDERPFGIRVTRAITSALEARARASASGE